MKGYALWHECRVSVLFPISTAAALVGNKSGFMSHLCICKNRNEIFPLEFLIKVVFVMLRTILIRKIEEEKAYKIS